MLLSKFIGIRKKDFEKLFSNRVQLSWYISHMSHVSFATVSKGIQYFQTHKNFLWPLLITTELQTAFQTFQRANYWYLTMLSMMRDIHFFLNLVDQFQNILFLGGHTLPICFINAVNQKITFNQFPLINYPTFFFHIIH